MLRLNVNPQVLAMCMAGLSGTLDELAYFTGQLQRSGTETQLYETNPKPDAGLEVVGPHAATKNGDWASMVHPHVLAQVVIDLGERLGQPCPDNTYVFENGEWQPLSFFQPSAPQQAPAPPAPPPAPTPAPAPVLATPSASVLMQQMASPQVLASTSPLDNLLHDVDYGQQAAQAAAAAPVAAPVAAPAPAPAAAPAPAQPAPQPAAAAAAAPSPAAAFPMGEFGMFAPLLIGTGKSASPFDKDPGGEIPKSPPSRIIRDIVDMAPSFFAHPAADVVGKGAGAVQRLRAFMAAAALLDSYLSSVPDQNTPVGYLRHHIAHLRYNASVTPSGPALKQHEDYLLTPGTGEK